MGLACLSSPSRLRPPCPWDVFGSSSGKSRKDPVPVPPPVTIITITTITIITTMITTITITTITTTISSIGHPVLQRGAEAPSAIYSYACY